ncbi:hypothetical protein ACNR9V_11895 [Parageobacillus thermoglucosidasius]|uniref:hypothetical protein n=1 Tax=Parageobacillus thermoglucosidasius TaxID=1426 RepID=UPI003B681587
MTIRLEILPVFKAGNLSIPVVCLYCSIEYWHMLKKWIALGDLLQTASLPEMAGFPLHLAQLPSSICEGTSHA